MDKRYQVLYTESAMQDLEEKMAYIALTLGAADLAQTWYRRLRAEILQDLAHFPRKYPLCAFPKWRAKGVRQVTFRNDVVLYSVDDARQAVYVWAVCTKGRDLQAHLEENT